MAHRSPEEVKRINIEIPKTLYDRFREILPYTGELTGFIKRAMETLVEMENPYDALKEVSGIKERMKERREL